MDFAAAGLLDGLQGRDREAREALLTRLCHAGATLDELTAAVEEDRLPLLLVERRLGGRYTVGELAEATSVPAEIIIRMRRLLGLPEPGEHDRVFSDEDIRQAESTKLFLDAGFSLDSLAELSRVLGESMSRLAATVSAQFAETFLRPGDSESDVAERFDGLAEQLTPALAPVLVATFNAHLRESVHRGRLVRSERESGQLAGATELYVCFADLVGFTRLGGELEVHDLGSVAGTLAGLAGDVADAPVRLIKTIGDAAMFVSPEAEPLVRAALKLQRAAEAADLPSLRSGIAFGPAVQRTGDFFGHSVNLASRVTGTARPDSVLCTQEVRDGAPDAFDWSYAGKFRLKGLSEPIALHRPRLPTGADESGRSAADDSEAVAAEISGRRAGRRRRSASR
jgi:adenylate cyclase